MNKLKRRSALVMALLMLFCPVLSVSAMETGSVEETEEGYYYFVNIAGRRVNYYDKYFTYKAKAGGYLEIQLAGLYEENDAGYHSVTLYGIKNGEIFTISKNGSIPILSYELLEDTGNEDAANFFKVGDNLYPAILSGEWKAFSKNEIGCYQNIITNIPYFGELMQVEAYLKNGDTSGNLNDYDEIDGAEEDASFAFTGFTATSEGRGGNIDVKWTGTTHDNKSTDYESMEYHVSATYTTGEGDTGHGGGGGSRDEEDNYETITGGKQTESNVLSGDISEKGFKKLYSFFKPPSGTYHLYSLKVLPTYTVDGKSYKGKPCYIYFDSNGNITSFKNEIHETTPEVFDDPTFELRNVSVKNGPTAMLTGKLWHKISWSGTTRDNVLKNVSPDKTYISVFFYGSSEDGSRKLYYYEDVYTYRDALRINEKAVSLGNSFEFGTEQAINACEADGLTFTGEVWLTPYYTVDNCIYKGKVTVVDVLNGKVGSIDPSDPDAPDEPVYPDDPDKPDLPDTPAIDIPSIDSILDVIPFFLSILKSFISGVGQVPSLFAYLFPFLPSDIIYLIGWGFVATFVLRVLGR